MSRVDDLAVELATAIQESDEYKQYLRCRSELMQDEELFRKVNEYRRNNFYLQNQSNNPRLVEDVEAFHAQNAELTANILVNKYLLAEMALCRMIKQVERTLIENVELDLEFLD